MVKIAVAGGTGNIATNLLKPAIASGNHEFIILTRSDPSTLTSPSPSFSYLKVDYLDRASLTTALQGVDTCLSFLIDHSDPNSTAQKNLIHACIDAGVGRFAPNEWGIKNKSQVPQYSGKDEIARYLSELQETGKLGKLQYSLFQPSILMDYFAHPYALEPDLITFPFFTDFEKRRAMIVDDGNQPLVITALADEAQILHRALEDEREWPRVGGIRGCRTTANELVDLGKKLRRGEWEISYLKSEDILNGVLTSSWKPLMAHPSIPVEQREAFREQFVLIFFKAILNGAWDVSDEWNKRFPEYKFVGAEEYITKAWEGKE